MATASGGWLNLITPTRQHNPTSPSCPFSSVASYCLPLLAAISASPPSLCLFHHSLPHPVNLPLCTVYSEGMYKARIIRGTELASIKQGKFSLSSPSPLIITLQHFRSLCAPLSPLPTVSSSSTSLISYYFSLHFLPADGR